MKFCPYCGEALGETMKFCPACGAPVPQDSGEELRAEAEVDVFEELLRPEPPPPRQEAAGEDGTGSGEPQAPSAPTAAGESGHPRRHSWRRLAVLLSAAFCAIAFLIAAVRTQSGPETAVAAPEDLPLPLGTPSGDAGAGSSFQSAAESVLYLAVYDDAGERAGSGSGFLIEDGQTLVTNYHVIRDAYRLAAYCPDNSRYGEAETVLAADPEADLAILRLDSDGDVPPLELADSDVVRQGDPVYAIGYPLGLSHTLSDGIVSSRYTDGNGVEILQITAPISPGSSGGALVNPEGKVVGVTFGSFTDGQNLNLAVASNVLRELYEQADNPVPLTDFYASIPHILTISQICANRERYDGTEVYFEGYVSYVELIRWDPSEPHVSVTYGLTESYRNILGCTLSGALEEIMAEPEYQLILLLELAAQYAEDAVPDYAEVSVSDPEYVFEAGDSVTVRAKVLWESGTDIQGYRWTSIHFEDVYITDSGAYG